MVWFEQVRKDGKAADDENEPMHVHITADTQESLDKAVEIIQQLLVPVEVRSPFLLFLVVFAVLKLFRLVFVGEQK